MADTTCPLCHRLKVKVLACASLLEPHPELVLDIHDCPLDLGMSGTPDPPFDVRCPASSTVVTRRKQVDTK